MAGLKEDGRASRATKWWQGQAATLTTEIGHLFDDPGFCAGFNTAIDSPRPWSGRTGCADP